MQTIVMGANNPMHVKNYTYKVEFQDRGAGHIHGTLWLRLDKIEKLVKNDDGTLRKMTQDDSSQKNVFKGLTTAFKKFRHSQPLDDHEVSAVVQFIDAFTTASIHENTVGKAVAKIVSEVNKHHHTKSCRKHDTNCRFSFPRFPTPITIVVQPCRGKDAKDIDKKMEKHKKVLDKVRGVLEDDGIIHKIMNKLG